MRKKIAAGNWKMNGSGPDLAMLGALSRLYPAPRSEILVCVPAPLIHRAAQAVRDTSVRIGAQDCHAATSGAHTGDVSADMLREAGAGAVILGHSERRQDHGETDADVRAKMRAAQTAGLQSILCVGETLADREADRTLDIIRAQLDGSLPETVAADTVVVAYEPIWAIGTGRVPDAEQIGAVHSFMRRHLENRFGSKVAQDLRLLYGGSVKATNAESIFAVPDVDGALVGGASLTVEDFSPIVSALDSAAS